MAYNAKTNWKYNDPVTEDDFNRIEKGIEDAHDLVGENDNKIIDHENKRNNPHNVTKAQIGLSNVKDVEQATKAEFDSHSLDKNNPHGVTKKQLGLENVDNVKQATKQEFDNHKGNEDAHFVQNEKQSWKNSLLTMSGSIFDNAINISDLQKKLESINFIIQSQEPIFGVKWDKSSNPEFIRTDVAENMVANVGKVFEKGIVNDFDDAPIFNELYMKAHLLDGAHDRFVKIPKFYIRKQDGPKYKSIQISKTQYPGFYLPKVFWDFERNRELDYFEYGAHLGSVKNGILRSVVDEYPTISTNIVNFRDAAMARGNGFQQNDIHAIDVLRTLMFVEFGTLDLQSVFTGYTAGRYHESDTIKSDANAAHIIVDKSVANNFMVGQSISVGSTRGGNQRFYGRTITSFHDMGDNTTLINFSGDPVQTYAGDIVYNTACKTGFSRAGSKPETGFLTANDGKHPFVYRGIENPYGDIYEWIDGININNNQAWVADNAEDYASNVFANPYKKLGYVNSDTNGYVKEMGFDVNNPFAEFPTSVGAGTDTYYSDYYYQATGQRVARFGGYWLNGSSAGLSDWALHASASTRHVVTGARLLRKPL